MKEIIEAHYRYRTDRRQYSRLNEEYLFIMLALASAPWWKRWWVFRCMVKRIKDGKII